MDLSELSLSGICQRAKTGQDVFIVRHLVKSTFLCFRPDNLFRLIQSLLLIRHSSILILYGYLNKNVIDFSESLNFLSNYVPLNYL